MRGGIWPDEDIDSGYKSTTKLCFFIEMSEMSYENVIESMKSNLVPKAI